MDGGAQLPLQVWKHDCGQGPALIRPERGLGAGGEGGCGSPEGQCLAACCGAPGWQSKPGEDVLPPQPPPLPPRLPRPATPATAATHVMYSDEAGPAMQVHRQAAGALPAAG